MASLSRDPRIAFFYLLLRDTDKSWENIEKHLVEISQDADLLRQRTDEDIVFTDEVIYSRAHLILQILEESVLGLNLKPASIIEAHAASSGHRDAVVSSLVCGCFHCVNTFSSNEITKWVSKGQTAICPLCEVEAVLPEKAGFLLTKAFLQRMHDYWF